MRYRWVTFAIVVLACQILVGCKSVDLIKTDSAATKDDSPWWKKDDLPPVEAPAKIVAIWANSVFNEPGLGPVRGLGGRVYFYNAKHKPVRVEGDLTVFLYDDTSEVDQDTQEATKRIEFSAEEVAEKYAPTEFGPSYSFWLPWDSVGGEQAQLSVIPVFTAKSGEVIVGEQARYLLPGKKRKEPSEEQHPSKQDGVFPASYVDSDQEATSLQLKSSTIKVPPSMQRRLRKPISSRRENRRSGRTVLSAERSNVTSPARQDLDPQDEQSSSMSGRNRKRTTTLGRDRGVVQFDGAAQPAMAGDTTKDSNQLPSADSRRDLLQARNSQSVQQASARDRNLLDRAKSLFDRSR